MELSKREAEEPAPWLISTLDQRIFQHTPGTYPRPSTICLLIMKEFLSFEGLGMPGVCSRGMLGFSWRIIPVDVSG